jgi:hypothetical protein
MPTITKPDVKPRVTPTTKPDVRIAPEPQSSPFPPEKLCPDQTRRITQ